MQDNQELGGTFPQDSLGLWAIRLARRRGAAFEPADEYQQNEGKGEADSDDPPGSQGAGDAQCGCDPDSRSSCQTLYVAHLLRVAQDHAGANEADARHDALYDTLDHAAQRVGMSGEITELDPGQRHDGSAERHQAEGAHAHGLVHQVAIDADDHADCGGTAKPHDGVQQLCVHGASFGTSGNSSTFSCRLCSLEIANPLAP